MTLAAVVETDSWKLFQHSPLQWEQHGAMVALVTGWAVSGQVSTHSGRSTEFPVVLDLGLFLQSFLTIVTQFPVLNPSMLEIHKTGSFSLTDP